jgi:hypothetical protein
MLLLLYYTESEGEANLTAGRVLELALLYNFVTEFTSLIVVADDNFTLDDGLIDGLAVDESDITFFGSGKFINNSLIIQRYQNYESLCSP